MKKLLMLVALACGLTGCKMTRPATKVPQAAAKTKAAKASPDLAAEARLAERLPLVTPDSINPQNAAAKAREMAEELNRDARRMDSARGLAEAPK